MKGTVYLVGAGPGDPGLMTVRALDLVQRADVLVYDYLASPEILRLTKSSCRQIYVGKISGNHALSQEEINALLLKEAKEGYMVVRLKGGDPYIFGRGGEEGLALVLGGIPFEEVPGVSSTVAAAAYAGIPLTHRDLSSQAVLMTGHERPDKDKSSHNWQALAQMGTISMVMGVKNLEHVCASLIQGGKTPNTKAALIQWGTTSRQRTVVGTLETLTKLAQAHNITAPALFVAGEVVSLHSQLNWFEKRPLFGARILVTRSRQQISRLAHALAELGAEVWERPTIAIEPVNDGLDMLPNLNDLGKFDWLAFTSPNGVNNFLGPLWGKGADGRSLAGLKIASIGPGTSDALSKFGLKADLVPNRNYVAEGLLAAFLAIGVKGQNIILAQALNSRDVLADGLKEAGAHISVIHVYKTTNPMWHEPLPEMPDLVTFTSASTARGLAAMLAPSDRQKYRGVAMGPVTREAAESLGFPIVGEAAESTIEGLVAAVLKCWGEGRPRKSQPTLDTLGTLGTLEGQP
ncbi:MAG: uroporphyrinogen-III C-methyltransferase [Candidatus Adiutrix sp.]